MPPYLQRPVLDIADLDVALALPYGMTGRGIGEAVTDLYAYLHALNRASIDHGYERLEDIMLAAGYSGLLSELVVRSVARRLSTGNPGVARNTRPGGRPDLVPRAFYDGDSVLRGQQGVEVKVTTSASSWQGHNPESGWIMVVQIKVSHDRADLRPCSDDRGAGHVGRAPGGGLDVLGP
jgi:hypothetical protein